MGSIQEVLDISYQSVQQRDIYREFDLYFPPESPVPPPLVCFIHGGAWRSEDKSDHAVLARNICGLTKYAVAVPNYRLSLTDPSQPGQFQHPRHAEDVLQFLLFVESSNGSLHGLSGIFDPTKLYIMGHSCSAHMLASIFLDSSLVSPSLAPSSSLCTSIHAVICSEGIYDLDLLISHFPTYREWFIEPAFGPRESYSDFSVAKLPIRNQLYPRWFILHSDGDTLVNLSQSRIMYDHLSESYGPQRAGNVQRNWELEGNHNDVLSTLKFAKIVSNFILNGVPGT